VWQRTYSKRVKRGLVATGVFDAPTQAAVSHVQKLVGLPVDGLLTRDTWEAVWTAERPPRPEPPKVPEPVRRSHYTKKNWKYWNRFSRRDITYATGPDEPPWFPGRPFGPHESGWHVRILQDLLQVRSTGVMNLETVAAVRGARKLAGLPVADVVDLRLAQYLDPGPYD
jgi:peptidoglycan hydrolase-like protein with peptidoglycan-binding domain